jgi:NTP pyrophosphatase (non-canonical NTP hydrolase)
MDLTELSKLAYQQARTNGFYDLDLVPSDVHKIIASLLLIHSEVTEATEALRKEYGKARVAGELADVIIRVLDLCGYMNVDIDNIVKLKMEANKHRTYKHGCLF